MINAVDDLDVSKYCLINLFFTKVGFRLKLKLVTTILISNGKLVGQNQS